MKRKVSKAEVAVRLRARAARKRHAAIAQSFHAGLLNDKQRREEHIKTRGFRAASDDD